MRYFLPLLLLLFLVWNRPAISQDTPPEAALGPSDAPSELISAGEETPIPLETVVPEEAAPPVETVAPAAAETAVPEETPPGLSDDEVKKSLDQDASKDAILNADNISKQKSMKEGQYEKDEDLLKEIHKKKGNEVQDNIKKLAREKKKKKKKLLLREGEIQKTEKSSLIGNDIILYDKNEKTGTFDLRHDTHDDANKWSFLFHFAPNKNLAIDLASLEAIYARRFDDLWWEFYISKSVMKFKYVCDAGPQKRSEEKEDLLSFGTGPSLTSRFLQHLMGDSTGLDRVFETTSVSLGWNRFNEGHDGKVYSGPGLKADFGIHHRLSSGFHYGLRSSYNLISVMRPKENDQETKSERTLVLSWWDVGVDLSFYF